MRPLTAAIVLMTIIGAWMFRWQIERTSDRDAGSAYLLDRWTGAVYLLSSLHRFEVTPFKKPEK